MYFKILVTTKIYIYQKVCSYSSKLYCADLHEKAINISQYQENVFIVFPSPIATSLCQALQPTKQQNQDT